MTPEARKFFRLSFYHHTRYIFPNPSPKASTNLGVGVPIRTAQWVSKPCVSEVQSRKKHGVVKTVHIQKLIIIFFFPRNKKLSSKQSHESHEYN